MPQMLTANAVDAGSECRKCRPRTLQMQTANIANAADVLGCLTSGVQQCALLRLLAQAALHIERLLQRD